MRYAIEDRIRLLYFLLIYQKHIEYRRLRYEYSRQPLN